MIKLQLKGNISENTVQEMIAQIKSYEGVEDVWYEYPTPDVNKILNLPGNYAAKRAIEVACVGDFSIDFYYKKYRSLPLNITVDFPYQTIEEDELVKSTKDMVSPLARVESKEERFSDKAEHLYFFKKVEEAKAFATQVKLEKSSAAYELIQVACKRLDLTDSQVRLIDKIAIAIASLDKCTTTQTQHFAEAIQYQIR